MRQRQQMSEEYSLSISVTVGVEKNSKSPDTKKYLRKVFRISMDDLPLLRKGLALHSVKTSLRNDNYFDRLDEFMTELRERFAESRLDFFEAIIGALEFRVPYVLPKMEETPTQMVPIEFMAAIAANSTEYSVGTVRSFMEE